MNFKNLEVFQEFYSVNLKRFILKNLFCIYSVILVEENSEYEKKYTKNHNMKMIIMLLKYYINS
jgi:hypothetical protein